MKIAVFVGGIAYEVQSRLMEGIRKYADEENINVFVFTCNGDIYRQSEYGHNFRNRIGWYTCAVPSV